MAEKKKNIVKEVKKVEKAEETISTKSIIVGICIGIIILVGGLYIYRWKEVKSEEKLVSSYLLKSGAINLEIKDLEEVNQILSEAPTEYFVLITYTGNEGTYKLEEGLKQIIDNYKLADSFYYLNVKKIMEEDNYIARLNNAFNTEVIKNVPIILYFRDGKVVDAVKRDDNAMINAGDFQKLLDIYEYKGQ